MDLVDNAQKLEELRINQALQKRNIELPFTGQCHYCDDVIETGGFCDSDCRDDFEQMNRK